MMVMVDVEIGMFLCSSCKQTPISYLVGVFFFLFFLRKSNVTRFLDDSILLFYDVTMSAPE